MRVRLATVTEMAVTEMACRMWHWSWTTVVTSEVVRILEHLHSSSSRDRLSQTPPGHDIEQAPIHFRDVKRRACFVAPPEAVPVSGLQSTTEVDSKRHGKVWAWK